MKSVARKPNGPRRRKLTALTLTAILHKEKRWYVAECPEVGTVSQGKTFKQAVANLKEAAELYLEEFPQEQTLAPFASSR